MATATRRINHLERSQDDLAANVVSALLNRRPLNKVYLAPQDLLQFLLHARKVQQAVRSFRKKTNHHIHVTLGPNVLPQGRTKERQLGHQPALAKRRNFSPVNGNASHHASLIARAIARSTPRALPIATGGLPDDAPVDVLVVASSGSAYGSHSTRCRRPSKASQTCLRKIGPRTMPLHSGASMEAPPRPRPSARARPGSRPWPRSA